MSPNYFIAYRVELCPPFQIYESDVNDNLTGDFFKGQRCDKVCLLLKTEKGLALSTSPQNVLS